MPHFAPWQILLVIAPLVWAITIDVNDPDSFKTSASTVASDMMTYYANRDSKAIPGKFDGTWWEGGAMFMGLIQYWHWTGDTTWNDQVNAGMVWQAGSAGDFFTANYTASLVRWSFSLVACRCLALTSVGQ
jgi:mannan endo-1,6-alpha-mannosidase